MSGDKDKDSVAKEYLERSKKRKKKPAAQVWFPGPACKILRPTNDAGKREPQYSSLPLLKNSRQWAECDQQLIQACTLKWVRDSFRAQPELRVAKVPFLHGVISLHPEAPREIEGDPAMMLSDKTEELEVRLHELLRSRYAKELSGKYTDPAILIRNATVFRGDNGEMYACCSMENFVHLVAEQRKEQTGTNNA